MAADTRQADIDRLHELSISLYVLALTDEGEYLAESRADEFPRAKVGKSCIRFKRLDDLDQAALRDRLAAAARLPAPGAV
jgi:hypothetical protein